VAVQEDPIPLSNIDVTFVLMTLVLVTALASCISLPAPVLLAAVGIVCGTAWHLIPALPPVSMWCDDFFGVVADANIDELTRNP